MIPRVISTAGWVAILLFDATDVLFANNLLSHTIRDRGGDARLVGNIEQVDPGLLENRSSGSFYPALGRVGIIDAGVRVSEVDAIEACQRDFDGSVRADTPDVGAHELQK